MNRRVKVSVILPSMNVVSYIRQCLHSVLDQTLKEIEVICIDAGSTDGTFEILEEMARSDERIRLLHSEIKSYGYQMNHAIELAHGEYIGIVETDDYVDSDMYEILYRNTADKPDVVKGTLYEIYENTDGSEKEIYWDYIPEEHESNVIFSPDVDPRVHLWDGNIWNGIYRRKFLLEHHISFNESPGAAFQDIGFQQMVLNEAASMIYMHAHFYHYRRVRKGGSTWNPRCIENIYHEYKRLLSDERIKAGHRGYICGRMAAAFMVELKKALSYSRYRVDAIACPEAVAWFCDTVRSALEQRILSIEDIAAEQRQDVLLLMAAEDAFVTSFKDKMNAAENWKKELRRRAGERQVLIFGAGNYGMALALFLIKNGFRIAAIADNQPWIGNVSQYGLRIHSAEDAVRKYGEEFFLIANKRNGGQISAQIKRLGIPEERIWIYDGSNPMAHAVIQEGRTLVD